MRGPGVIVVVLALGSVLLAMAPVHAAGGDPPAEAEFAVDIVLASDPGSDADFVGMPSNVTLRFEYFGQEVGELRGPQPVIEVGGNTIKEPGGGWSLFHGGAGPLHGIQLVDCIFDGHLSADATALYGTYRMGTEGELPGGEEVVYQVRPKGTSGDANKDGRIDSIDALLVLQHGAGLLPQINNGDVNIDGSVTAIDASLILQLVAGRIDVFPLP